MLWHTGVLALILVVFSLGVYALMERQLHERLDAGLRTAMEGTIKLFLHEKEEGETDDYSAGSALRKYYYPRQAVGFYDGSGVLLKEKTLGDIRAVLPADVGALDREGLQFYTIPEAQTGVDDGLRASVLRINTSPQSAVFIVISQPAEDASDGLRLLGEILAAAVPIAILLTALGGRLLARKSLEPVVVMSESARRIGAENMGERLPVRNPRDELGRLAATFNELLGRLQAAFSQQRQFMADASHELRTPLSVIRTATGVTLEQEHPGEQEYRDALETIDVQARRLTRSVEDMFTLARADAGHRTLELRHFYLDELVAETARAAGVLAARKGVDVDLSPQSEAPFYGDEGLLRQMLLNLLDNAVKHTLSGGLIKLSLERHDLEYRIQVADSGAGIPAEAQAHIFERFYRADKARPRSEKDGGSGAGLGLSIARWITQAHGGSLRLKHSDHNGSIFVASLPTPAHIRSVP